MDVAVSLAAIDRSLGIDLDVAMGRRKAEHSTHTQSNNDAYDSPNDRRASTAPNSSSTSARAGPQSMFDAFKKWTMENHTFSNVELSDAEMGTVSDGVKQLMTDGGSSGGGGAFDGDSERRDPAGRFMRICNANVGDPHAFHQAVASHICLRQSLRR